MSSYFRLAKDDCTGRDYGNDSQDDFILYRPNASGGMGKWFVMETNTWTHDTKWYGLSTDVPVPCDRNGDGYVDLGLFRQVGSNAKWFFLQWNVGNVDWTDVSSKWYGLASDVPLCR